MWNLPGIERLAKMPGLYETENIPLQEKMIYLHFYIADCHWYAAEFDGDLFFGFAILNGDLEMAEWGYVSLDELEALKIDGWLEVDCETETSWKIRKASEIEKIRIACDWPEHEVCHEPVSVCRCSEIQTLKRKGSISC